MGDKIAPKMLPTKNVDFKIDDTVRVMRGRPPSGVFQAFGALGLPRGDEAFPVDTSPPRTLRSCV